MEAPPGVGWIGIGGIVIGMVGLLYGYLSKRPLIPASQIEELRGQLSDCRAMSGELRVDLHAARNEVQAFQEETRTANVTIRKLRQDVEWWRDRSVTLQRELDDRVKRGNDGGAKGRNDV